MFVVCCVWAYTVKVRMCVNHLFKDTVEWSTVKNPLRNFKAPFHRSLNEIDIKHRFSQRKEEVRESTHWKSTDYMKVQIKWSFAGILVKYLHKWEYGSIIWPMPLLTNHSYSWFITFSISTPAFSFSRCFYPKWHAWLESYRSTELLK